MLIKPLALQVPAPSVVLHLLPPPRAKNLWCNMILLFLRRQINPAMPLDINSQLSILERIHARFLYQMCVHYTLPERALDVESEAQMLSAPFVCLLGAADVTIARPARP